MSRASALTIRFGLIDWLGQVPQGAFVRISRDKAHLSAQETPSVPSAWLSQAHAYVGRTKSASTTSSKGPSPSHRLVKPKPRDRRVRRRADFDRVFQLGRHNGGKLLSVRSVSNQQLLTRFAFAIPKRVGGAVVRNRVRRRLREILRSLSLIEGFDVVISVRPEASKATFQALKTEMTTLMRRGRLIAAPE